MTRESAQPGTNPYRQLPSVDTLLQQMPAELARWGHRTLTAGLQQTLAAIRAEISAGATPDTHIDTIRASVVSSMRSADESSLKPVFNLSGTVLHTNLGRASLPPEALEAVATVAASASTLEFDLETGERGDRESHIESLLCELTGAEAATAVNNNAAAVLLVLNTLALNREVPVSRGELVEIGGSFRIPEVMQRSNCTLVEIGATNRTHLEDYKNAINDNTALLMKVHTSNYRVEGFTHAVEETELAALAQAHALPFVIDLGSGSLLNFSALGLPDEPTAREAITNGADIITFSGDKLLGGPQAGLIAGRRDLIQQIKRNPLKRALRLDKMTLAAMMEVLKLYRDPERLQQRLPTLRQLTRPQADIQRQGERLLADVQTALGERYKISVVNCASQVGSGALPIETIPSAALHITACDGQDATLRQLASDLRQLSKPVIGRLHKNALWLDLRCLEQEADFLHRLNEISH